MGDMVACSGGMVNVEGVPEEIKILPLGHVHTQKGDFDVDDESVSLIRKQFQSRRLDLVIDYEHQTLKDVQAPAGGWISDIYKGEDAVIAKVKWTNRAKEYLKNREYRYLSPVVIVRKKDRKATAIHSAGLTNTPAIDGMFALVNSVDIEDYEENKEDKTMDLKKLAAALGLPEDATQEDIEKAIATAQEALKQNKEKEGQEKTEEPASGEKEDGKSGSSEEVVANSVILSLLGLDADAKTEDVATAIMTLKAGAGSDEILALREELKEHHAEEMVQAALKSGKITAAQKDWAKAYALSDKDGFQSFMDKAPTVVPQGKMDLKDAPESSGGGNADTIVLKNCGISTEDVEKHYKKEEDKDE